MNAESKGFAVSIGFHACVFALVAGIASAPGPERARSLSLDISIGRESAAATPTAVLSPVKEKARPAQHLEPEAPAINKEEMTEKTESISQETAGSAQASSGVDRAAQTDTSEPSAGSGVSRIDLSALREHLQRSIVYPAIARRMGWEGRVVVSFTVCADGTVRNVRLVESSGKPVLDRNALDVVKSIDRIPDIAHAGAGIPEVVLPIVYRLDG